MAAMPCTMGFAGPYPCLNVDLLAIVPTNTLSGGGSGSGSWGWTDPVTGKEYAIQGHSEATSFVDISNPESPIFLGTLPTAAVGALWREMRVYKNHVFIVADFVANVGHGMQIFDLTRLRSLVTTPAVLTADARYTGFGKAHTITINEDTGFAYANGSNACPGGGPYMMNIQNPLNPIFVGCVTQAGYTHDSQCVVYHGPDPAYSGHEICLNGNGSRMVVADVTIKSAPIILSSKTYPNLGYTHQAWFTEDHAYFLLDDEYDESNSGINTTTYIWDARDLDNPVLIRAYAQPTTCIDHNQYIRGNFVYQANYTCGLRVFNLNDVASGNLNLVAYFDTVPGTNAAQFVGAWNNYPYYNSGVVVVSDIEQGMFILRPRLIGPSAAHVSVGGRVMTSGGQGISKAAVALTDDMGNVRAAITSSFGYFNFPEVESGKTYVLTVRSKRYNFEPTMITVNDEISDLIITPIRAGKRSTEFAAVPLSEH